MVNVLNINLQLNKLRKLLSSSTTDISWSNYDSVGAILEELSFLENGMRNMKEDAFKEMLFLLAPTNNLQEISISSGWADEFLDIADNLEKEIHHHIK